jgi:ParB-like chromosome segregation protein Spo0J
MDELRAELEAQRRGAELPAYTPAEYEGLVESMRAYGQLTPIVRVNGKPIGGRHRLRACGELGLDPWFVDLALDDDVDVHELELAADIVRRHLTTAQRRRAVEAELVRDPTRSDRSIAVVFGVSPTTVGRIRGELEERGRVSILDSRRGRDGRVTTPSPSTAPSRELVDVTIVLSPTALEALTGALTAIRHALDDIDVDAAIAHEALDTVLDILGLDVELDVDEPAPELLPAA